MPTKKSSPAAAAVGTRKSPRAKKLTTTTTTVQAEAASVAKPSPSSTPESDRAYVLAPTSPVFSDAAADQEVDLDALLAKASKALAERKAAIISLQTPTEAAPSALRTVKIDSGFDKAKGLYFTNSGRKYGPVRLQDGKAAVLEEATGDHGDKAGGGGGGGSTQRLKVQIGPERFAVQKVVDTLPPALDWDAKQKKKMTTETSGPKWFDMPAPEVTEQVKRDLHILKSRPVIDPKVHYKRNTMSAPPKYFQFGTIVQGNTEFFSARLTRKERRDNITDELMADNQSKAYYKRKFLDIQDQKGNFTRKGWKRPKDRK
ncbi:hypothetical protein HKX48_002810 [Thoreauomyces humboldtii]|nr:hypothetical protein HKX48_002810 [Thoreauomyces humboldtii]